MRGASGTWDSRATADRTQAATARRVRLAGAAILAAVGVLELEAPAPACAECEAAGTVVDKRATRLPEGTGGADGNEGGGGSSRKGCERATTCSQRSTDHRRERSDRGGRRGNCVFCSIAALHDTTVTGLLAKQCLEQSFSGESPEAISGLLAGAGLTKRGRRSGHLAVNRGSESSPVRHSAAFSDTLCLL